MEGMGVTGRSKEMGRRGEENGEVWENDGRGNRCKKEGVCKKGE